MTWRSLLRHILCLVRHIYSWWYIFFCFVCQVFSTSDTTNNMLQTYTLLMHLMHLFGSLLSLYQLCNTCKSHKEGIQISFTTEMFSIRCIHTASFLLVMGVHVSNLRSSLGLMSEWSLLGKPVYTANRGYSSEHTNTQLDCCCYHCV